MTHVVVIGAVPSGRDLKKTLGRRHEATLVGSAEHFDFMPLNSWGALGRRKPDGIPVRVAPRT